VGTEVPWAFSVPNYLVDFISTWDFVQKPGRLCRYGREAESREGERGQESKKNSPSLTQVLFFS
jgi:hypothetical protein